MGCEPFRRPMSRALALGVLAILLASALAGCTDRLSGQGTLKVYLRSSDEPSVALKDSRGREVFYPNKIGDFLAAPLHVLAVSVGRDDGEIEVPAKEVGQSYDLVATKGTDILLYEAKVRAGTLGSVSFTVRAMNASTAADPDVEVKIAVPYTWSRNLTLDVAGEASYVMAFLISEGPAAGGGKEYFLMRDPAQSRPT